jgi:mannitol-specific phosphotransferase system IIBC component
MTDIYGTNSMYLTVCNLIVLSLVMPVLAVMSPDLVYIIGTFTGVVGGTVVYAQRLKHLSGIQIIVAVLSAALVGMILGDAACDYWQITTRSYIAAVNFVTSLIGLHTATGLTNSYIKRADKRFDQGVDLGFDKILGKVNDDNSDSQQTQRRRNKR